MPWYDLKVTYERQGVIQIEASSAEEAKAKFLALDWDEEPSGADLVNWDVLSVKETEG